MTPKLLAFLLCSIALVALGQQPTTAPLATQAEKFKFGKSIYMRNDRGSTVAYDAIASDIQGWGRFLPAASPEKADLVAEVSSTENGGVTVESKSGYSSDGKPNSSSTTSRDLSASSVSLKVLEAKSKRELWSGTERVKSAFKKKTEGNNLLDASEKLFKRFHDYVEPPEK